MKIAVCLSGQPRSFRVTAKNLLSVFREESDVSIDFYFHLWTTNGDAYSVSRFVTQSEDSKRLEQEIQDFYHPVQLKIEQQKDIRPKLAKELQVGIDNVGGEYFQSYSFYQSLSNVQFSNYDLVVWTRPDAFFGTWNSHWYLDWNYMYSCSYLCPTLWVNGIGPGHDNRTYCGDWIFIGKPDVFMVFQGQYREYFIDRVRCRTKYIDKYGYEMGAFHLEGIVPAFLEHNRLGIVQDSKYVVGDLLTSMILRQCFPEAGIDVYSEEGYYFITTYRSLYQWPVSLTLVKDLYREFLMGNVIDLFQDPVKDEKLWGEAYKASEQQIESDVRSRFVKC